MSECLRPLREKRIRLNSWNSCQLLERAIAVVDDFEFGPVQNLFDQFKPAFERRKKRVALDDSLDEREVKIGAEWQRLRVNLHPAADDAVPLGGHHLRTALHPVPLSIRWGEISLN